MKLPLTISLLTVAAVTSQELKVCQKAGCSGEICSDEDIASICIWREEFACYQDAVCERQANGQCGWRQTEELQSCLGGDLKTTFEDNTCKKTGCSGQVCSDEDIMTTCEWREEYACYGSATCERQADGQCGWTETEELKTCLNSDSNPQPKSCVVGGCSGQICGEEDPNGGGLISTCEWREEYACYGNAACERQGDGQCGWTVTKELEECLSNSGSDVVVAPVDELETTPEDNICKKTGCSGQVCSDEDIMTTCEWREEYACYGSATCERQADGQCGWTETEELKTCLSSDAKPKACVVGGCSGQICGEEDPRGGLISTCEWREEYACYSSAACERQEDGQCGWTMTKELEECISIGSIDLELALDEEYRVEESIGEEYFTEESSN